MKSLGIGSPILLGALVAARLSLASTHDLNCPDLMEGFESAAEIELSYSPQVAELLTTTDSTLSPILQSQGGTLAPPLWLVYWVEAHAPQYVGRELKLPWRDLDSRLQRALISYSAQKRGQNFDSDHKIPGLVFEPLSYATRLNLTSAQTDALTKVAALFSREVEFREPSDIPGVIGGIELHARAPVRSGKLMTEVTRLFELLGLGSKRMHIHMPFLIQERSIFRADRMPTRPTDRLPFTQGVFEEVEFYRRLNILTELAEVMEPGGSGRIFSLDSSNYFTHGQDGLLQELSYANSGPLTYSSLWSVLATLVNHRIRPDSLTKLGKLAKVAAVGFRDRGTYDDPSLFGYEFRKVNPQLGDHFYEKLLNRVQTLRNKAELGISVQEIRSSQFYQESNPIAFYGAMNGIHFGDDRDQLAAIERVVSLLPKYPWRWLLNQRNQNHLEYDYILHDWSEDLLGPRSDSEILRLQGLQIEALLALQRGEASTEVVRRFLQLSGIYSRLKTFFFGESSAEARTAGLK